MNRLNPLLEYTQAIIAVVIIMATVTIAALSLRRSSEDEWARQVLSTLSGVVIGHYFSRGRRAGVAGG